MPFLSLIELSRPIWDRGDLYAAHRFIWKGFPDIEPGLRPFLYSCDESDVKSTLLIQSTVEPTHSDWLSAGCKVSTKPVDLSGIAHVGRKTFKLKATPTKDRKVTGASRGDRIPIGADLDESAPSIEGLSPRETALFHWLQAKGERYGFSVSPQEVSIGSTVRHVLYKNKPHVRRTETPMVFHEVAFKGELTVTDGGKFLDALEGGIGRARGLGFGLLLALPKL